MLKDAALGFWTEAFPAIHRFWTERAARLTNTRNDERPVLAESGTVCIRELANGSYACWASTIGEHPIGSNVFVRLGVKGEWKDGHAALENVEGELGDGEEATAHNGILERCEQLLAEGYEAFMLHNGEVFEDEPPN